MTTYELSKEELKERLSVLKTIKNIGKKNRRSIITGEIKYIEEILRASDFSTHNEFPTI